MTRTAAVALALAALLAAAPAAAVTVHTLFTHSELEWQTLRTAHFRIHYDRHLEEAARYAAAVAELAYARVGADLNFTLDETYDLVLRDSDDIGNGLTDPADGSITVWLTPMDFNLRGTHRWLQNVIYHELTHMLHMRTAGEDLLGSRDLVGSLLTMPNLMCPVWFTEGLAQYKAERGTERYDAQRAMILRAAVLDDALLPYAKMCVFGKNAFEYERAYSQGYALVRHVAAMHGDTALAHIVHAKGESFEEFDAALKAAVGQTGEELYDSWVAQLRAQTLDWNSRVPLGVPVLLADAGWSDQNPAVSTDGRYLAYTSNGSHDFQRLALYRQDRTQPAAAARVMADDINPGISMSTDGGLLLYTRTEEDRHGSNYNDLFAWTEAEGERRITRGARVTQPALLPGGTHAAAVRTERGHAELVLVDLADGSITTLYAAALEEQLFAPQVSPDGHRLLYGRFTAGQRDLCVYDLRDGSNLPLPCTTAWNEATGCWLDNRTIAFAADYENIYDLFIWDEEQVRRVTRTSTGLFEPARLDAQTLAATQYTSRGFDVVSVALDAAEPYTPPPAPDPRPGDEVAPETGVARAYTNVWRSPYRVPWLSYDGTQLAAGLAASANDVLARHIVNLQANYNFTGHSPLGGFQYINRVWFPTITLAGFATRRAFADLVPEKSGTGFDDYHERWRGLDLSALFPVTNRLSLSLGGRWEKVSANEALEYFDGRSTRPYEGKFTSYALGARYRDLIPTSDYDIGIASGYEVAVEYAHQVKALDGDFDYEAWTAEGAYFLPTRWQHQALALRLRAGRGFGQGPAQGIFRLGGSNGLRGYASNLYRGSKLLVGSVEYTLPLWYDIAHLTSFLYFDGLYLRLFGDCGRAWDGPFWWRDMHSSYGGSLILKAAMYYSMPYHVELGAARGLDDRDGVRLYLGLGSTF